MADIAERDVVPVLARQAELFAADADLIDTLASAVEPTDVAALRDAAPPVARRALRRWIVDRTGAAHPPDASTVERVLAVVRHDSRATELGGGWHLARTEGRLRIERTGSGPSGDARHGE